VRIAVMGSGGVGGYFGGLLAQAGEDVTFIARGEHLQAIQSKGLRVESVHGDFNVRPAKATDDPSTVGTVDAVLFATKTFHIEEAAAAMQPMVGPETVILPLQNGVEAPERLLTVFEPENVLVGACWIISAVAEPGVIRQASEVRRIALGELDGRITPRVEDIAAALRRAGATVEVSAEINKELWTKFLWVAAFSGLAAVTRVPLGELLGCAETRQLFERAMQEIEALAEASGVTLDEDVVAKTVAFAEGVEPTATASMQRDIMEGRPSELAAQNGFVAQRGAALGVPVPVNTFVCSVLLPLERRARAAGTGTRMDTD